MSDPTAPAERGLTSGQVQQFEADGYLVVRDVLPREALQPLIHELEQKVDRLTREAVRQGLLDAMSTYPGAPFDTRLALVSDACLERSWLWQQIQSGQHVTPGMFTLRTWPTLLDIVESLMGSEILAHPRFCVRASLPAHGDTVLPWHQDLAALVLDDAEETSVVNLWIPLVPATASSGCIQAVRRSHLSGLLPYDVGGSRYNGIANANLPAGEVVTCALDVGDILIMSDRLVYRSLPNMSRTVGWSVDTHYSRLGRPTGYGTVPGFVARSQDRSDQVARSHHDWIKALLEAGLDPTQGGGPRLPPC